MISGLILYEGPSQLDGAPIVCIATGLNGESWNKKTGPMVQTWILRSDIAPEVAVTTGEDAAVCGSCSLRGIVAKLPNGEQINRLRSCYVFVGLAPQKIWESYRKGDYHQPATLNALYPFLAGKLVRFGSYGDPCAVPIEWWNGAMLCLAERGGWTGYTHQWRDARFQEYKRLLMASVESAAQAAEAHALGWRTFRVGVTGEQPAQGEFHCPASSEENYRETCETCGACDGTAKSAGRASVLIWPHGPPAAVKSFYRLVRGDSPEIDHRKAMTDADRVLLAAVQDVGRASAKRLAGMVGRGAQATATRLWHLRQMGLVRRIARGEYEAIAEHVK